MNAAPTFDERTADAIRRAMAEASAGRLLAACLIAERALADGAEPIALHALLGMLRCRAGDFEIALNHLRSAQEARPQDISIACNLTAALVETGRHEEAYTFASPKLAEADRSLTILRYRGYAAQLLGRTEEAAQIYEAVVNAVPTDWQSWNNLANARLLLSDSSGAVAAFERSLRSNPEPKLTWLNLAKARIQAGDLNEAEACLRAVAERFPQDRQALLELHDLLKRRGREGRELREVLEDLHCRDPLDRGTLLALASRQMADGDVHECEAALRAVLRHSPSDSEAYMELARLYEHAWPEKLLSLAEEAEAAGVGPPSSNILRAFAHRRSGDFARGLEELRSVPSDFDPQIVQDLRGQLHDKLGQHDAAFIAFKAMNEAHVADPSSPLERAAKQRVVLRNRLDKLTPEWVGTWQPVIWPADERDPAFLVGFPRSGTTLLDTMLMGHAGVTVLEEEPVLQQVEREFGGFEALPQMDEGQVLAARASYFRVAANYGYVSRSSLLVDKSPLQLTQIPLIHRLFPNANFILALRHPADAVLSCFFSNFRLNAAMANFLRLDTAAEYYNLVFEMWSRATDLLPVRVHPIRYEDLIEDPEGELRPVAAALGIEWRSELTDHLSTAATRGLVKTASYAQVTKPLYRTSVGRWRNYREHLEPVLPVLRPWADKFGYVFES